MNLVCPHCNTVVTNCIIMDRARAAGYIDNNFVQNQQRIRKRKDHLARLQKIKSRKPGSSVTLDNNAPVVLQSAAEDPRKKARKGISSIIIERENKVLLQRISAILLEPAKNTLEEYNTMKKLIVPKNAGKARAFEQHMQKVRNEKFFENLRKQKAVYNVKKWEEDYQVQKTNQRFMREVKYERPPGFVDPFTQPPLSSSPTGAGKHSTAGDDGKSPGRESSSAAHVHRIRNMRHDRSSSALSRESGGRHRGKGGAEHTARAGNSGGVSRTGTHHSGQDDGAAGGFYDGDAFEDDDDYGPEDGEEFRELLAEAHRDVRVSEEVVHQHQYQSPQQRGRSPHARAVTTSEAKLHVYLASADVRCWLVNSEVIVLSAEAHDGGRLLEAEAEISLEDLAVLRGEDPALLAGGGSTANSVSQRDGETVHLQDGGSSVLSMGFDMQTLQQMAQEMVAHVELRVDAESGARLILNLVSEEDALLLDADSDASAGVGTIDGRNPHGSAAPATNPSNGVGQKTEQPSNESLLNEDELGDMLIDDDRQVVLTMGARVPVHFENQVITASVANLGTLIDAAKIKNRKECVYALVRVVSTEEDQLAATLYVMSSTVTQFKRFARPAVVKGSILKISTALPSVVHADPELVHTFARNMVASIKVVHSNRTGKNSLTVDNVG